MNQGLELRDQGDVPGAIEKLKAAHALAHTPVTGIELGRTYASAGKLVEAREAFLSVAGIPPRREETPVSAKARTESSQLAEEMRARIPSLTVRVTGVTADSVAVTIDDALVPREALMGPRLMNPGSHHVLAKSTSGGIAETSVDLKEGEARDVELKIIFTGGDQAGSPPAAPASSSPPS
jgi:hypothetical protein